LRKIEIQQKPRISAFRKGITDKIRRLKNASKTKAFVIREIKLTHSKNGRH